MMAEAPDNSVAKRMGRYQLKRLGRMRGGEATEAAVAEAPAIVAEQA